MLCVRTILAVSILLLSAEAFADDGSVEAPSSGLFEIMTERQRRNALLRLELEEAKLRAEIATARAQAAKAGKGADDSTRVAVQPWPGPQSFPASTVPPTSNPQEDTPVVMAIGGTASDLAATVMLVDGLVLDVRPGHELPGGYKVVKVTPDTVVLEKGGRRLRLGLGFASPPRRTR